MTSNLILLYLFRELNLVDNNLTSSILKLTPTLSKVNSAMNTTAGSVNNSVNYSMNTTVSTTTEAKPKVVVRLPSAKKK